MYPYSSKTSFYNIHPYSRAKAYNLFGTDNPDIYYNYIRPVDRYYNERYDNYSMKICKTALINKLHMLWEQHIVWTRLTITSILTDSPDVELVTNRLLQNPVDFETALRPFYGDKIAAEFRKLFTDHLTIAAQLVKAAKAGDTAAAAQAEKNWYANANEIAIFLSRINPYWSQRNWQLMLYDHLKLTKAEAVAILTKNYSESIRLYDEIEKQALEMADVMAEGIIKQFHYKFICC